MRSKRLILVVLTVACLIVSKQRTVAAEFSPEQVEFFENKIRPVLVRECYECHAAGAKQIQGGLSLDTRAALLKGATPGPPSFPAAR